MRKATHNGIVIAIGLFAGVLVVSGNVLYRNVHSLYENSEWVVHTHEVLAALEALHATIVDAETGQRGYILTGSKDYLGPYKSAVDASVKSIERVGELTHDNPQQQERVARLKELVAARFTEMQRVLDAYERGGIDAARAAMSAEAGWGQMGQIRSVIEVMRGDEQLLLRAREATNQATFRSALANAILSTVVGIAALGAVWFLVHHHLQVVEQAAREVHEQRELLQAALISIGDGVIATDDQSRVTLLNGVAEHLTGWRELDAIGQTLTTVFQIVNEETRQPVDNPARRALREGQIVGLANHTILIAKDGKEWPLDDSAAPIRTQDGRIAGAILVFREIGERKRQEQLLMKQATELEEADHRKDEFLATLAHELRNPLSPLSNALQLWPFVQDNRAELERLRGLMTRHVRQMTRLIDDLLDVSRITNGKVQLYKQQADVKTLINEALEAVKPLMEVSGQQLTVALPQGPLYVEGDVARLTQIFGNILNNAAKYSGRGGVIWVSADSENGQVVVKVRDNGPGIPRHMLSAIFEMFRQGDGTLERAHGGLGIGLTLVKRLVEEHGGNVEAHSEGPGRGSEFVIRLPALSIDPAIAPSGDNRYDLTQVASIPAHRILVVDDVKASAQTLAMMLRAIRQQVAEANDGPSAIEWVKANDPTVVFLDIAMPGMSGYEVARCLRSERPNLTLVALTGYGQEDDRRQAIEAGFNHHLIKPTNIEVLQRILLTVPGRGES